MIAFAFTSPFWVSVETCSFISSCFVTGCCSTTSSSFFAIISTNLIVGRTGGGGGGGGGASTGGGGGGKVTSVIFISISFSFLPKDSLENKSKCAAKTNETKTSTAIRIPRILCLSVICLSS